ncbi:hypothetical protein PGT21_036928 [Puccinia graminis f. sp. tritici]|uniref:Uncharacterized protein n=1 Tax=Puccinia graminis f. sp. tritici TaxID=56615 RepID=A0A5B0QQM3_PUCGR|nr:hypothetical protein PGT21_036928 [Puccinia graminis f. sp. tritici]
MRLEADCRSVYHVLVIGCLVDNQSKVAVVTFNPDCIILPLPQVAQPQLSTGQSCGPEEDSSRRMSSDHSGLLPVEPYLASSIPFRRRLQPCPRRAMQKGDEEISAAATSALCPVLQSQIQLKSAIRYLPRLISIYSNQ